MNDKSWENGALQDLEVAFWPMRAEKPNGPQAVAKQAQELEQTAFIPKCRWISTRKRVENVWYAWQKKSNAATIAEEIITVTNKK